MNETKINVLGNIFLFKTNSDEVFGRIKESFQKEESGKEADAKITFEKAPEFQVKKDFKNREFYFSYPEIEKTVNGYGYINISKWVMRIATYLMSPKTLCFHSSAVSYNGNSSLFLSHTVGGKTTISLGLIKYGFKYINDEYIYITENEGKFVTEGVASVFPHLRAGTVFNNSEYEHLRNKFKNIKQGDNLWESTESVCVNIVPLFGKENITKSSTLKNIFLVNFSPEEKSSLKKTDSITEYEKNTIEVESLRCIHKLVEADELDFERIDIANENISREFDINIEERKRFLKKMADSSNIYLLTLGYDIVNFLEKIAEVIKNAE